MVIGLDYDGTYTAFPELWDVFIFMCESRDIRIICVTGRPESQKPKMQIEVICVPSEFKADACRKLGIDVDIWIDDMPGMIEPARILQW